MVSWLFSLNMAAQETKEKATLGEKFSKAWKGAVESLTEAGHELGDAIGFDDRIYNDNDAVEIGGTKYMPLYLSDVFADKSEGESLKELCRKAFAKDYPAAEIVNVSIPQPAWIENTVKRGGKIARYENRLYCHVLGKDGDSGYINVRYMFETRREPGKAVTHAADRWPKKLYADVMTASVYKQLKELDKK